MKQIPMPMMAPNGAEWFYLEQFYKVGRFEKLYRWHEVGHS